MLQMVSMALAILAPCAFCVQLAIAMRGARRRPSDDVEAPTGVRHFVVGTQISTLACVKNADDIAVCNSVFAKV
jgi:hypothetical protein